LKIQDLFPSQKVRVDGFVHSLLNHGVLFMTYDDSMLNERLVLFFVLGWLTLDFDEV